jgi:hypothetical protein
MTEYENLISLLRPLRIEAEKRARTTNVGYDYGFSDGLNHVVALITAEIIKADRALAAALAE